MPDSLDLDAQEGLTHTLSHPVCQVVHVKFHFVLHLNIVYAVRAQNHLQSLQLCSITCAWSYNTMKILVVTALLWVVHSILDRDFYDNLQVPVSASPEQIREAFRKLSKKYHPDRNPETRDKFQQINVAYETLMDEHKKYIYDRLGKQKVNEPHIEHQYNLHVMKGPLLLMHVNLPLKDFYTGKTTQILIEKEVACPHCKGSGAQNAYDVVNCHECGGKGKVTKRVDLGNGFYNLYTNTCPRCEGRGKVIGRKCHLCTAQKIIQGIQQFNLTVPAGIPNEFQILVQNMGNQRLQGAPSDLSFKVRQIPHPYFKRVGSNLHTVVALTLKQALLGFQKTISHLDGRVLQVNSDQQIQPGQVRVIEGEGMPVYKGSGKGNMLVEFRVSIPLFGEEQLQKLEEFFKGANMQ